MKLSYLFLVLASRSPRSPADAARAKHAHAGAATCGGAADAAGGAGVTPARPRPRHPRRRTPNLPTPQAVPKPSGPAPGAGPTPPPPHIDAKSWVLMDYASGQILLGKQRGCARRAGVDHQGHDLVRRLGRARARQDPHRRSGHDQRERVALRRRRHRRLDELPAAQQPGAAEGSPLRNDHPVRQRRRDRARRAHRRFRGNVRRS